METTSFGRSTALVSIVKAAFGSAPLQGGTGHSSFARRRRQPGRNSGWCLADPPLSLGNLHRRPADRHQRQVRQARHRPGHVEQLRVGGDVGREASVDSWVEIYQRSRSLQESVMDHSKRGALIERSLNLVAGDGSPSLLTEEDRKRSRIDAPRRRPPRDQAASLRGSHEAGHASSMDAARAGRRRWRGASILERLRTTHTRPQGPASRSRGCREALRANPRRAADSRGCEPCDDANAQGLMFLCWGRTRSRVIAIPRIAGLTAEPGYDRSSAPRRSSRLAYP